MDSGANMTRSIKFYQRRAQMRCDRETMQMPVTFFAEEIEDETKPIVIRHVFIKELNLTVPYLAYHTKKGDMPLDIPDHIFNVPLEWKFRKDLKMRWFRRYLPEFIGFQYYVAEMIHLEGCDSVPAIESGQVIRNLRAAIETRLKFKNALPAWNIIPGYVPAVMHDVC